MGTGLFRTGCRVGPASLKTRADRDGDHYALNGQKTWTTLCQHTNRNLCLVRTAQGGKPQEGISFVLVGLDTPGIDVRPIRLIEGGHEVNEVFLDSVRVPVANLVGEENKGWTIAKFLLTHERTNIAGVGTSMPAMEGLKALARQMRRRGRPPIGDPLFAARLARVETDLEARRITNLRMLFRAQTQGQPGPETSILKIKGTLIHQQLHDPARRALGPLAAPFPGSVGKTSLMFGPATLLMADAAGAVADAVNAGRVALCAVAVGAMDAAPAMMLEYLRTRRRSACRSAAFRRCNTTPSICCWKSNRRGPSPSQRRRPWIPQRLR